MKNNIIFGICYEDGDIYSTTYNVVFGYKKIWKETKDPNLSLIPKSDEELILLLKELTNPDDIVYYDGECRETLNNVQVPILWGVFELDGDDENPPKLIQYVESLGFEYSEEFGEIVEKIIR